MFKLAVLVAFVAATYGDVITSKSMNSTLTATNGLDRGDWGEVDLCPEGTYAATMELKYDPRGNVDDTCANGLKLYCYDAQGFLWDYVTSTEGKFGQWQGIRSCPAGNFITGFALRVEGLVGNFDDDLGVVDVRMKCEDGTILDGLVSQALHESPKMETKILAGGVKQRQVFRTLRHKLTEEEVERRLERKGLSLDKSRREGEDGEWGTLTTCPLGTKVCGIETQVEEQNLYTDDAGLCNVKLFCCS